MARTAGMTASDTSPRSRHSVLQEPSQFSYICFSSRFSTGEVFMLFCAVIIIHRWLLHVPALSSSHLRLSGNCVEEGVMSSTCARRSWAEDEGKRTFKAALAGSPLLSVRVRTPGGDGTGLQNFLNFWEFSNMNNNYYGYFVFSKYFCGAPCNLRKGSNTLDLPRSGRGFLVATVTVSWRRTPFALLLYASILFQEWTSWGTWSAGRYVEVA